MGNVKHGIQFLLTMEKINNNNNRITLDLLLNSEFNTITIVSETFNVYP